jgi:hypothetical protein
MSVLKTFNDLPNAAGRISRHVGLVWAAGLLLLGWQLPIQSALAMDTCQFDGLYRLHLPEGQTEAHCVSQFDASISQQMETIWGAAWFTVEGGEMYEIRVVLETRMTNIQESSDQRFKDDEQELQDLIGVEKAFRVSFKPGVTKGDDPWSVRRIVRSEESDAQTSNDWAITPTQWDDSAKGSKLKVTFGLRLSVRRLEDRCWVEGTVRGETVYGHNAYWSDSPTGTDMNDNPLPVQTDKEADDALAAIAGMDLDPAMLKQLGLDPKQVADAKNQARKMQLERKDDRSETPESTYDLSAEMEQFRGHTFLTLQSIKGDDDVARLSENGEGSELAGPASAADMAMTMGHILSQFSATVEMQRSEFVEDWKPVRAGLVNEGLKYTWDGKTGEEPVIELRKCGSGTVGSEALCGTLKWADIADLEFRALNGAFACINN